MAGGHRVGVCGTAVYEENRVSGIRDISSLNIRIAREVYGAADELLRELDKEISGLLIAGPPSSGKTTILRDLARQLSIKGKKVVVIDERGELGGAFRGYAKTIWDSATCLQGFLREKEFSRPCAAFLRSLLSATRREAPGGGCD